MTQNLGSPKEERARLLDQLRDGGRVTAVVPLTGSRLEEVEQQWAAAAEAGADLVEWRLDHLEPSFALSGEALARFGNAMRSKHGVPVLATYRTEAEGGGFAADGASGAAAYRQAVRDTAIWADLVDVELVRPGADDLIEELKEQTVVVASFHNFEPEVDEEFLKETLTVMGESGAGVAKVAWMVADEDDLETIQDAQRWARKTLEVPAAVIGMGELGKDTRLGKSAELSAISFAMVGAASAPGQPTLGELRTSSGEAAPN